MSRAAGDEVAVARSQTQDEAGATDAGGHDGGTRQEAPEGKHGVRATRYMHGGCVG